MEILFVVVEGTTAAVVKFCSGKIAGFDGLAESNLYNSITKPKVSESRDISS